MRSRTVFGFGKQRPLSFDPYAALGLPRTASADDVRKAYRLLAKELHPDVRPNDRAAEEKFKRATAAFNLLSDPAQRARFDRGEIDADGNERATVRTSTQSRARPQGGMGADSAFDMGDIFADLFGSSAGGRGFARMRGRDIRLALEVEFADAVNGGKQRIQTPDGRSLDVAIPAGVETGQTLRLKGQGGAGVHGGPPGDALVELTIKPHPFFRREGDDIHIELPISLAQAVEGGRVEAPTTTGPVALVIPAGANTGMRLRLKGRGVQGAGDQLVRLLVMLPEEPDEALKQFVQKWARRDDVPKRPTP